MRRRAEEARRRRPRWRPIRHDDTAGSTSRPPSCATSSPTTRSAPTSMLYPRDPSLDPQLVWKGKDEQDADDLEVPAVPIYIQETIDPQALVENLRDDRQRPARPSRELTPLRRLRRPRVRGAGRLLPPRRQLVEPDDPRRLAARDDEPRREGGPQGQGPDDLHRPALRHQVRHQLAGLHAQARREGRQGRRTSPASPSRSAPSATPGSSASTPTCATCATGSSVAASC